jgi:hypothetical protein
MRPPPQPNERQDKMSKIYCEIPVSARRTVPTARAHSSGMVRVKNWGFAIEATISDHGGGDRDVVHVVLVNLQSGERKVLTSAPIAVVAERGPCEV